MNALGICAACSQKVKKGRGFFRVNRAPFSELRKALIVQRIGAIFRAELFGVILQSGSPPNPEHGFPLDILPREKPERFKCGRGMREEIGPPLRPVHQDIAQRGRGLRFLRGLRYRASGDGRGDGRGDGLLRAVHFGAFLGQPGKPPGRYPVACMRHANFQALLDQKR